MRSILLVLLALISLPGLSVCAEEARAKALLRQAGQALQAGRFDEAERLVAEAESEEASGPHPANAEVRALREGILMARGAEARRRLPALEQEISSGRCAGARARGVPGSLRRRLREAQEGRGKGEREEVEPAWRLALGAKLQQTVHIRFDAVPFLEVRTFLQEAGHLLLMVDRAALEARPDLEEAVITLTTPEEGMSLQSVLNLVTRQVGLKWTLRDEAVLVTTEEGLEEPDVLSSYDIQDLRMKLRDFPGPKLGLGGSGPGIQIEDPKGEDGPEALSEEDILEMIQGVLEKKPGGDRR